MNHDGTRAKAKTDCFGASVTPVTRYSREHVRADLDLLAVEEPLSVIATTEGGDIVDLGVMMRTPGDDEALVAGLLFAEGLVGCRDDILRFQHSAPECRSRAAGTLRVTIAPGALVAKQSEWHDAAPLLLKSSACGLCGRKTVDKLLGSLQAVGIDDASGIRQESVGVLASLVNERQVLFSRTGGLHAAALFTTGGELHSVCEDIGRHNAVDKLIGGALLSGECVSDKVLFLSGRAGFELLHKAAVAKIPIVASVGAPSSLAVEVARRVSITLLGFIKNSGFNVYSGEERVYATANQRSVFASQA